MIVSMVGGDWIAYPETAREALVLRFWWLVDLVSLRRRPDWTVGGLS